ncbi:acyl-CoA thioesterase [Noviherbaspirillum aridicola]|uniref:Acyl-CoA thioesterase n=1 Tax=Noviherbaspirillum aridicola TaxID=2849687 RepID=A0ABQ4Q6Q8_9BURK|nr:thioesterase family protein [Noviherbaspirillum aridicola]GIZ52727.1 acyl-CoA thioesterase [Noviherbaspirillum aridicola]
MTAHVFDAALALNGAGETLTGHTHPAYANMVGPFGGMISAVLLNAVLQHPQRLGDPVSLTVHYAAPIADGGFGLVPRVMRTNRTTQHWLVELVQAGGVAAYATAVTATRRDTWSASDAVFPEVPPADRVAVAPPVPRAAWTASYEMRFIDGALTMEEGERADSLTRLWIRDQPPRPLDYASLSAICDAFFPRIFVRRPKWVPVGTVTLTTYFHADAAQLAAVGAAPVLGVARANRFEQGFFDQSAEIWSGDGKLLAASHQLVYFKE